MASTRIEVGLFGERRSAEITKNRCNWKVAWRDMPIDTFVPVSSAICAREAAMKAANRLESLKWGNHVLMASLRGAVDSDSAISRELALWIISKRYGRPFDRHSAVNPSAAVDCARTALFAELDHSGTPSSRPSPAPSTPTPASPAKEFGPLSESEQYDAEQCADGRAYVFDDRGFLVD